MGIPDFHRSNIKYKSADFFLSVTWKNTMNTNIPLSFSKKYIIIELHSTSYRFYLFKCIVIFCLE